MGVLYDLRHSGYLLQAIEIAKRNPIVATLALALSAGTLIVLVTWSVTTIQYINRSKQRGQGKEPPTLPYAVPWLGSAFGMRDPHAMYDVVARYAADQKPIRLILGPMRVYIITGSENVRKLFKGSAHVDQISFAMSFYKSFGMANPDYAILEADKTRFNPPVNDVPIEQRIWSHAHDARRHLANNEAETFLGEKFAAEMSTAIAASFPKEQWDTVCVFQTLRSAMLKAGVNTLMGPFIFQQDPNFAETFNRWDDAFLTVAIGVPRFLYSKGWAAGDKVLEVLEAFLSNARKNYHSEDKSDPSWEENYGSRYFRVLCVMMEQTGISLHGQLLLLRNITWAANANPVPAAGWAVLEVLQHADRLACLREEVLTAATLDVHSGRYSLDIPRLITLPLLSSIYTETLRVYSSATVSRQLVVDMEMDGYILKKDCIVMAPGRLPMVDPQRWSTAPDHPVSEFWPERFLKPSSESIGKKKTADTKNHNNSTPPADALRPENFFPYGGGVGICPGRFFAKKEIMITLALMVLEYEFDIQPGQPPDWVMMNQGNGTSNSAPNPSDRAAKLARGYEGVGIVPPDRDLRIRMRRRRGEHAKDEKEE